LLQWKAGIGEIERNSYILKSSEVVFCLKKSFGIIHLMKQKKLTIQIHKPVADVFAFCIKPPKAKLWVPNIIDEKTSELLLKLAQCIQNTKLITHLLT